MDRHSANVIQRLGVRAVQADAADELSPRTLSQTGRSAFRHLLGSYNLELTALGCPLRLGPDSPKDQQQCIDHIQCSGSVWTPAGADGWRADGAKYYIGNANAADLMSVLAKTADSRRAGPTRRSAFVFFGQRPAESPAYQNVRKILTLGIRWAFVGEFEVKGHPVAAGDVILRGREA